MATAPAPPSASLYVGDLDREVTEAQLYELFSQVGPVASIRVCRDAVTRRSLGYAYVNYNSAVDESAAERALDALNYQPVNGRPMRIMWSHRDPSARRSGVGNIFIKNLDESIDNKALHDTFQQFGNILSCKVAMLDGVSKGYGFVHFETEEGANTAIEKVNGMLLCDKKVFVGKFLKKSERGSDSTQAKFTNIFVKNLDVEVTEETLHAKFLEAGEITNLVIMRDEHGASRGFGFVNYKSPEFAKEAVEKLNGTQVGTKTVYVGRAQKKAEREQLLRLQFEERRQERLQKYQGVNLYIKNLDDSIDDEKLAAEFEVFGAITSAKIMRDDKGNTRGFGFVCFGSVEEANKAVAEANGRMICGKPIYVALAQRKEVRRAQLEQQYALRLTPAGMPVPPGAPAAMMRTPGALPGVPVMYPPMYYTPNGVMPPGMQRQPVMYAQGQPQQQQQMQLQPQQQQGGMMVPIRNWRPVGPMGPNIRPGSFPAMQGYPGQFQPLPQQPGAPQQVPPPQQMVQQQPPMAQQNGAPAPPPQQAPMGQQPTQNGMMMAPPRGPAPQQQQNGARQPRQRQQGQTPAGVAGPAPANGVVPAGKDMRGRNGRPQPQPQAAPPAKFAQDGRPGPLANGAVPQYSAVLQSNGVPNGIPNGVPNGIANGVPNGMPNGMHHGMPNGMPNGFSEGQPMGMGAPMGAMAPMGMIPVAPGGQVAAMGAGIPMAGGMPEALNSSALAAAPPHLQKQMLGERLFPLIQKQQGELGGKITGMLLEMDNSELLLLLESPEALVQKIEEALQVLQMHGIAARADEEEGGEQAAGEVEGAGAEKEARDESAQQAPIQSAAAAPALVEARA
eukprot:TRINITY_DN435_c0_g3_i1.p1 TRINITY_DN435_c0_g3~~TRINITY_DN435_c0_g3_i1.p1  ORF type:complete len:843 (-),score=229.42 TRINITY_DN435_c0_g3_i1:989-3517(-)